MDCNYVVLLVRTSRLHFQISRASEFVGHIALGGGLLGQRDGIPTIKQLYMQQKRFDDLRGLQFFNEVYEWQKSSIMHFQGCLWFEVLISCWIVTLPPLKELQADVVSYNAAISACEKAGWLHLFWMKSDEHLDIQQGNQGTYTYKDVEKQLIWRIMTLGD